MKNICLLLMSLLLLVLTGCAGLSKPFLHTIGFH